MNTLQIPDVLIRCFYRLLDKCSQSSVSPKLTREIKCSIGALIAPCRIYLQLLNIDFKTLAWVKLEIVIIENKLIEIVFRVLELKF